MKKGILLLLLAAAFSAQAQQKSLKDLLYSGKLKKDSSGVIRKDDDLSSKIDTSTKMETPPESPKPPVSAPPVGKAPVSSENTAVVDPAAPAKVETPVTPVKEAAPVAVKSNNKIWKDYTDSLAGPLKSEVLNSKKIKKDTYYFTVEYEIGTDGAVTILNVVASPENAQLQEAVKERMSTSAPQLAPVLDSNNQPRKTKRKYNFSITKD